MDVDRTGMLERVQTEAARVLGVAPEQLTEQTPLADLGADSLDFVEIVVPIEEALNIDAGQAGLDSIVTVADFVDHLLSATRPQ